MSRTLFDIIYGQHEESFERDFRKGMQLLYGEIGLPYYIRGCHVEIGKIRRRLRRVGDFLGGGFSWIGRHGLPLGWRIHGLERWRESRRAFPLYVKQVLVF